ncbi:MAG: hypothetical protein FWB78_07705 [Treponema sp.]|nr:hypothetical protein [Treponema sp.]
MFSEEMRTILHYVLSSLEVWGVTIALILFLSFVSYVARSYRRPRFVSKSRPRKSRRRAAESSGPRETEDNEDTNQALGLEEE